MIDWDAEAAAVARYAHDEMFAAHRGAMPWRQVGIFAVFGNDGYGSLRTQTEVAAVRQQLEIRILGFGVNPGDGESWAMLVETDQKESVDLLDAVVWEVWEQAWQDHHSRTQLEVAHAEIARSGLRPDHSVN